MAAVTSSPDNRRGRRSTRKVPDEKGNLSALLACIDARDTETARHCRRVADLAYSLALILRPDDPLWATRLSLAARLHDIGKIGIPDAILSKPGPLTDAEMAIMQRHPVVGEQILAPVFAADPGLQEMLAAVRGHHERWDGGGYPDKLAGDQIPLGAQVLAVCDSFDAMGSHRPYRAGMGLIELLERIQAGAGSQWAPGVVAAFLSQRLRSFQSLRSV